MAAASLGPVAIPPERFEFMTSTTPSLTRGQARDVDRRATAEYGMSGLVLMENAGRGVADKLVEIGVRSPVTIFCGLGNNGGDGFVIARHLDIRQIDVVVVVCSSPPTGDSPAGIPLAPNAEETDALERVAARMPPDARANFRILRAAGLPIVVAESAAAVSDPLRRAGCVVDALLGVGSRGRPRPPLDAIIAAINDSRLPVVAVDLPSGLDCDTGVAAEPTIRAEHTCTFVANKAGFLAPDAHKWTGVVHVLDIGAPRKLIDDALRAREN